MRSFFYTSILLCITLVLLLIKSVSSPRVTFAASSNASLAISNPTSPLSRVYPSEVLQWEFIIIQNAQQYQLDPNLIAAVILQESGGNAQAYSASGAVGLMQIMPCDGIAQSFICSGHPCFQNRPSMQELFDPEFNISYGVRYLAGLVNKYGNEREALYHYGPMDVGYRYAETVLTIYTTYQ